MIRDYIVKNGKEWENIIHEPEFGKYFTVQGTALKNVPAGYEELADAGAFVVKAAELFRIMKPFNDYLNKALAGFQMPVR